MPLTYKDLYDLLTKHQVYSPESMSGHISIWDPESEECLEIENAYINNTDSPTADILDKGHLVLTLKRS